MGPGSEIGPETGPESVMGPKWIQKWIRKWIQNQKSVQNWAGNGSQLDSGSLYRNRKTPRKTLTSQGILVTSWFPVAQRIAGTHCNTVENKVFWLEVDFTWR